MIYISRLQYVTQRNSHDEILNEVRQFLTGGGDWVQLRMKDTSFDQFLATAYKVKELCYAFNATFIINDNVEVALRCGADGVHLGKGDMPTSEARRLLGRRPIIGRTANTKRDIEILSEQEIDYIGMGPYKWTATKKNIASVLGSDGYKTILEELRFIGVDYPPIVAIGSVGVDDVDALMKIEGIYGVAVSGAIANSANPVKETMNFICEIEKYL